MDVDDVPIAGSARTDYWATIKLAPGQSDTQFSGTALTDLNTPDLDVDSWDDNGVLYIYGPTGLVMEFNRYHCSTLLFDPQGSCSVSSNGIVQGSWYTTAPNYSPTLYDGYGNLVWTASVLPDTTQVFNRASAQPFQYKGQYGYHTDGPSSLSYCLNRYYDPNVGRWTQRDPSGLDGGVNVYAYCDGDPMVRADPHGLDTRGASQPEWKQLGTALQFLEENSGKSWESVLASTMGMVLNATPTLLKVDTDLEDNAVWRYGTLYLNANLFWNEDLPRAKNACGLEQRRAWVFRKKAGLRAYFDMNSNTL